MSTSCVERTSVAKWSEAQAWERNFWIREQKNLARYGKNIAWYLLSRVGLREKCRGDDSNRWWKKQFDGYTFLPPTIENAIEVGCGPYTNMRLIRQVCHPRNLVLSDPLIETYAGFRLSFIQEMSQKRACTLDNHALETLPFGNATFDLVVMINVLDHVQDAIACIHTLSRLLKRQGIIIIGQDLTNEDDLRLQPEGMRIGH